MINEDYMHLAEKLGDARRALMLPHPEGETESIVNAFSECSQVLRIHPTPDVERQVIPHPERQTIPHPVS